MLSLNPKWDVFIRYFALALLSGAPISELKSEPIPTADCNFASGKCTIPYSPATFLGISDVNRGSVCGTRDMAPISEKHSLGCL